MKVVAFNGSPHKQGNTYDCLQIVLHVLKDEGINTELVQLAPLKIQPCMACFKCAKKPDGECHGVKDGLNEAVAKMFEADGILIGSPTWFSNVTGHVKNLIDRSGIVALRNNRALSRKVGAAVVAVRRAGAVPVFDAINRFFFINGMIVPGSTYWNLAIGREPGECLNDQEGVETLTNLGRNIAWLMKKIKG
jgi:multimeric flavodoxin WrbA